jgi:serine/threonine protein kinase
MIGSTMIGIERGLELRPVEDVRIEDTSSDSSMSGTRSIDVKVDKLLGSGSFASVYSVNKLTSPPSKGGNESKMTFDADNESATQFTLILGDGDDDCTHFNDTRYLALKCLSKSSSHNKYGADCLAQEVAILQKLPPHSNIIKIFGVSTEGFILLQRIRETLDDLLFQWRLRRSFRKQTVKWPIYLCFASEHRKEQTKSHHLEQHSRVQTIALGLARAMAFAHHHGVLYRDLKPANVGIDYQGQVRLFDFGFARTCNEEQGRLLTHMVGTPRYMSPEVACSDGKYGFPSDVHSFAMVLWEMLALRKPFENTKCMKDLLKALHAQQKRPSLKPVMSLHIRSLLKASWHPDPDLRPTFALIVNQLEKEEMLPKVCSKSTANAAA